MAFVKFTETGKSFTPKISISQRGLIGFNHGARKRFEIDNFGFCVLYYDCETSRIAVELTNNQEAQGAIKIRLRAIGADVGAKSFLTYFNILPNATYMYPVTMDESQNWLIVELEKGKERKSATSESEEDA